MAAVPSSRRPVTGSPSTQAAIQMVDKGPTMPTCDAIDGPSSCTPRITIHTGSTVQATALTSDKPQTCQGMPPQPGLGDARPTGEGELGNQLGDACPTLAITAHW